MQAARTTRTKKKHSLQILLAQPRDKGLHVMGQIEIRGSQNRPCEKEQLALGTNLLLLQLLHTLWLKSAYTPAYVAKGSGKVRNGSKEVSKGKVLRLHTVFGVLTQSEDLVSSLLSIYSSTSG